MSIELQGPPAELRFTVSITRAATGEVEHFDMVGRIEQAPPSAASQEEEIHVGHP